MARDRYDWGLSVSKLNVLCDAKTGCPRCFWLHVKKKVERPRGIFPGIPGALDGTLKSYFDRCRGVGAVPVELAGSVQGGRLWGTVEEIKKQRQWQSAYKVTVETKHGTIGLIGAIDDMMHESDGLTPVDGKSKGSEPQDDDLSYYQLQVDTYHFIWESNGHQMTGRALIVAYWPTGWDHNGIAIKTKVLTMQTDPARCTQVLKEAAAILAAPTMPDRGSGCEQCLYVERRTAEGG